MLNIKNILVVMALLIAGCSRSANNENPSSNKSDSIVIIFKNALNQSPISYYQFGMRSVNEELPLHMIFGRDSLGVIDEDRLIIPKKLMRQDSMIGYFSKIGFELTQITVSKASDELVVQVMPHPSQILLKIAEEEVKNRIDSVQLIIENNNRNQAKGIIHSVTKTTFTSNDIGKDLCFISEEVLPKDDLTVQVIVFYKNGHKNIQVYNLIYQPHLKTIIEVM